MDKVKFWYVASQQSGAYIHRDVVTSLAKELLLWRLSHSNEHLLLGNCPESAFDGDIDPYCLICRDMLDIVLPNWGREEFEAHHDILCALYELDGEKGLAEDVLLDELFKESEEKLNALCKSTMEEYKKVIKEFVKY